MARLIAESPGTFRNIVNISRSSYSGAGEDESLLPDYLRQAAPTFMLPTKDILGTNTVVNMALPVADLSRVLNPRELLSGTNPVLKAAMEYPSNYELFYDRPTESTPGQVKRVPTYLYPIDVILANKITGPAWEPIKRALGIVTKKDEVTGKDYLAAPAVPLKMIKDFFPYLNTISRIGSDPLESGQQSVADILGETIGIKISPFDTKSLEYFKTYEDFSKMQELVSGAKQQGQITKVPGKPKKKKKAQYNSIEELLNANPK
jgi:hypothetical protein